MNTLVWVLSGLLAVDYFLVIFGAIKNISVLHKISKAFIMPFASAIILLIINSYRPETNHIFFLTLISLAICSLSEIFFVFDKKILKLIGNFFFFVSLAPLVELYITTLHVYKIPNWFTITFSILTGILLILLLIFTGKNKLHVYAYIIIGYGAIDFLFFCASASLLCDFRLCYGLLTGGFLVLLLGFGAYIKQTIKPLKINKKVENILGITIITLAESLIATSGLLMIL